MSNSTSNVGIGNPILVNISEWICIACLHSAAAKQSGVSRTILIASSKASAKVISPGKIVPLSTRYVRKSLKVIVSVRIFTTPNSHPSTLSWPSVSSLWLRPLNTLPIALLPLIASYGTDIVHIIFAVLSLILGWLPAKFFSFLRSSSVIFLALCLRRLFGLVWSIPLLNPIIFAKRAFPIDLSRVRLVPIPNTRRSFLLRMLIFLKYSFVSFLGSVVV